MLHLKSPHEKWDYLEKRFGSIPRPESWLAAEEAMRQWETQPEQSAAGETIQSTCDSHDEPENLTGSQENTSDSPNDRTEIPTGYLEPKTEIVDVRQTEGSSLVDEAGATGATWPDESMNASKVPDDEVMASQDLPGLSSKALEPKGNNLLDTTSERAETKTGHTKPEPDVVDAQQVVDILSMFEDGIADQERLDEHSNTLEAPDKRSQCTADKVVERRDSPEWSPEACKPAGDTAKRTRKCSIGFAPKTYLGQDQRGTTSSERRSVSNMTASSHHDARSKPSEDTPHRIPHLTRSGEWGCIDLLEQVRGIAQTSNRQRRS
ncbi:hypothetical protein EDC04DRAFT_85718 [Pisolithus marmoratus]|nr:hypothetical protein EDC04DRAFT_85718 [Pisolithus marmoratus]